MIDQSKVGTDWSADELDAIVDDYFAMLALDAAGQPFVKAHRARALMEQTGRSHRAVEFKHMNISAVAAELGCPTSAATAPWPTTNPRSSTPSTATSPPTPRS